MIIIQKVKVEWTKASRGGSGAEERNKVPEAFRLPIEVVQVRDFIFHTVGCLESNAFACEADFETVVAPDRPDTLPLKIQWSAGVVETRFIWSKNECGAPRRNSHSLFQLQPGQWGRFICNGRFSKDWDISEWTYHKTVFNVAYVSEYDRDLFCHVSPNFEAKRLARLW